MSSLHKPLFDGEFVAFSPFDRIALRDLIRQITVRPARMLEIGCWLGNGSTQVFIDELRGTGSSLVCVDTWRGNPNVDRHQKLVAQYDVFGTFLKNVTEAEGDDLVKPFRANSEEASLLLAEGVFDLVFIDADHSYQAVKDDIVWWRSKVKPGGILCGHDCEARAPEIGFDLLRKHLRDDTCEGTARFPRVHPGSILAVHEAFGARVNLWAETVLTLPTGQPGSSTIWWVPM